MAQNVWINLTLDGSGAGKHNSIGGSSGAGDLTLAYDNLKLTTLAQALTVLDVLKQRLIGSGLK
jgi:hypothetical protein